MWWSMVVQQRGQRPEDALILGSWNGAVMGDRPAKKAAKAVAWAYLREGGPGQPRLIKSPNILAGSIDFTPGVPTQAQSASSSKSDDELLEHILAGRDPFEGSPFYGNHPDDVLTQMELLFRDAGAAVIAYLSGLDNVEDDPGTALGGLMGFGAVTAQAEFWRQCRRRSGDATDSWLAERHEAMLDAFVSSSSMPTDEAAKLIPEAARMITQNWEKVMTLASAILDDSFDLTGREVKFLRDIYGEPSDELSVESPT